MSIFATCLEKIPGSMDVAAFMPVLANALMDLEDIQLQAHHIVITTAQKYPNIMVAAMDHFVPALEAMFMDKTFKKKTANKTGTELERAKEWIKSGLRALLAMSKLEGAMTNRRFATLVGASQGRRQVPSYVGCCGGRALDSPQHLQGQEQSAVSMGFVCSTESISDMQSFFFSSVVWHLYFDSGDTQS